MRAFRDLLSRLWRKLRVSRLTFDSLNRLQQAILLVLYEHQIIHGDDPPLTAPELRDRIEDSGFLEMSDQEFKEYGKFYVREVNQAYLEKASSGAT